LNESPYLTAKLNRQIAATQFVPRFCRSAQLKCSLYVEVLGKINHPSVYRPHSVRRSTGVRSNLTSYGAEVLHLRDMRFRIARLRVRPVVIGILSLGASSNPRHCPQMERADLDIWLLAELLDFAAMSNASLPRQHGELRSHSDRLVEVQRFSGIQTNAVETFADSPPLSKSPSPTFPKGSWTD
jgi:hypothetical protein